MTAIELKYRAFSVKTEPFINSARISGETGEIRSVYA